MREAMVARWARMASREGGWKRRRSWRLVMRRVLDGGAGEERGGRLERSSERFGRDEVEEDREALPELKEGKESIILWDLWWLWWWW